MTYRSHYQCVDAHWQPRWVPWGLCRGHRCRCLSALWWLSAPQSCASFPWRSSHGAVKRHKHNTTAVVVNTVHNPQTITIIATITHTAHYTQHCHYHKQITHNIIIITPTALYTQHCHYHKHSKLQHCHYHKHSTLHKYYHYHIHSTLHTILSLSHTAHHTTLPLSHPQHFTHNIVTVTPTAHYTQDCHYHTHTQHITHETVIITHTAHYTQYRHNPTIQACSAKS